MTQTTTGIQRIADDYGTAALVVGVLLVFGLLPFGADFLGYSTNIYTELISVVITILVLDRRAQRREYERRADEKTREQQRQREERIARIIREMRSPSHEEGARAADEAREMGILKDGTLGGANLKFARLGGVDFRNADLHEVTLWDSILTGAALRNVNLTNANLGYAKLVKSLMEGANLHEADLKYANLEDAKLHEANLGEADLTAANLSGTDLTRANLSRATLIDTKLMWTNLIEANLTESLFTSAEFDEETTLPDGSKWTPGTDINRFTDPYHPHYWQNYYTASGFDTFIKWYSAGKPRPWIDAGYDEGEWNEWVRDGKPAHKPTDDTST